MASMTQGSPKPLRVALTGLPSTDVGAVVQELSTRNTAVCLDERAFTGTEECPTTAAVRFERWEVQRLAGSGEEAALLLPSLEGLPDLLAVVLERQHLERHLHFCASLMDLGVPMVALLRGSESTGRKDLVLHMGALEERLGFSVIETPSTPSGVANSLAAVLPQELRRPHVPKPIRISSRVEEMLERLVREVAAAEQSSGEELGPWPLRAQLLRALEGQRSWAQRLTATVPELARKLEEGQSELAEALGRSVAVELSETRYAYAAGLVHECLDFQDLRTRVAFSDRLDHILLHPVVGIPVFFVVMYGMFWFTFQVGEWPVSLLEWGFGKITEVANTWWPHSWPDWTRSMVVDGILGGVGGVTVFVPNIFILYFCISLMETSGYMSRATFLVDGLMHRLGLHGRSFLPMILGLGCSVPAMMATKTIDNRHDRLATLLAIPLIPCGARLPVFMLLIPAFFPPAWRSTMLFVVYATGIVLAFLVSLLLRRVLFPERAAAFVMELPPYRRPTFRRLLQPAWLNTLMYLRKAGTVILVFSMALWIAAHYPILPDQQRDALVAAQPADAPHGLVDQQLEAAQLMHSALGRLGKALEPVFAPLGFDWRIATAGLSAIAAKEVFVAQMGVVFSKETQADPKRLGEVLAATYPRSTGVAVLFFMLLTFPCISSMVTTYREAGSWKYVALQVALLLGLAYVVAFLVKSVLSLAGM